MWVIRFDFPERTAWAYASDNGSLGYTFSRADAAVWSQDVAERMLENGWGEEIRSYGVVEPAEASA